MGTLIFPVVAIGSFVWILTKWEEWGTPKSLAVVVAWVFVGGTLMISMQ